MKEAYCDVDRLSYQMYGSVTDQASSYKMSRMEKGKKQHINCMWLMPEHDMFIF